MITQKRAAYQSNSKIAELAGRSIDEKPINVENGSEYTEIDTGRVYVFDAENVEWIEKQSSGGRGGAGTADYNALTNKPSIAGKTLQGNVSLADIGAMQAIDIDTTPIENSNNLIASGGVSTYVENAISDKAKADLTNVENDVFRQKIVDSGYVAGKIYSVSGSTKDMELNCPAKGTVDGTIYLDLPDGVSKTTHTMQASIRVRDTTIVFPVITGNGWYTEDDVTKAKITFTAYNPNDYEIASIYVVVQAIFIEK